MDLDLRLIYLKRALGQHQLVVGVSRAGAPLVRSVIEDSSGQDDLSRNSRRRVVLVHMEDTPSWLGTPSWLAAGLRSHDQSSGRDKTRCSNGYFASRQHNRSPSVVDR